MSDDRAKVSRSIRMIETTDQGKRLLEEFNDGIESLSGMAIEVFGDNKVLLLSPIFRDTVLSKARQVNELHLRLHNFLCVDWLQEDKE